MISFLRLPRVLCAFCVLAFCTIALAQNLIPVPALTAHVIDQTGTLDAIQLKGLEDKLMAFEQAKGTQIAILMVASTLPEDDASFANRVGNTWKIGRKGVGDGVLIVVAKDDRKVRVEVAKALEGAIPDLAAQRIIDEAILPKFRQGDFAGGLQAGADQLIARINGEPLPAPPQRKEPQRAGGAGFDWGDLAIFLFVGVFVAGRVLRAIFGRPLGSIVTGGGVGVLAWLITSSLLVAGIAGLLGLLLTLVMGFGGRGGPWAGGGPWIGGGGFGHGGGFGGGGGGGGWGGSGGGGDFGGGGASGNW